MTIHRLTRALAAVALFLGLLLVPVGAASASPAASASSAVGASVVSASGDVNDFTFDSMAAEYELTAGTNGAGSLRVTETYVANFTHANTHRGMRITVPDSLNGNRMHPTLVSLKDENGKDRDQEVDSEDGFTTFTSRAESFVTGKQTYVFSYTVDNVISHYPDQHVEDFYWDVLAATWEQPFAGVTVKLTVDPSLVSALTGHSSCYFGARGATTQCALEVSGATVTTESEPLAPKQGLTIAVGFREGTFTRIDNSYLAQPTAPLGLGVAGVGVVGVIVAIIARRTALKDARGRGLVVAQYEPPAGIDAMQAAVLLNRVSHAVPAEILEQAVRGSIQIQERGGGKTVLVLVDASKAGDANGRELLERLFAGERPGAFVDLSRDAQRSASLTAMVTTMRKQQLQVGLRRRPSAVWRVLFPLVGFFLVVAAVIAGIAVFSSSGSALGLVVAGAVLVLVIVAVSLVSHNPLTPAGGELNEHLEGLKTFMKWAEADRITMLQSVSGAQRVVANTADPIAMVRLYEPLLPFAVVFGIEKSWAKTLVMYYDRSESQPYWYSGTTPFSVGALTSSVSSMSYADASSSSSFSGSSGGGSVGGGGGGTSGGGV